MNEHGQRRRARPLLLAATAALVAACGGQDPTGSETQDLSGQIATHNFASKVLAVRGETAVAWSAVDADGRFDPRSRAARATAWRS